MRSFLFIWTIGLFSPFAQAQSSRFVSQTHSVPKTQETPQVSAGAGETLQLRCLPLWGEFPKTASQKREDENFLKVCDENFGNRQEASQFFAERGWEYIAEGELDTACYRFNLAELLNSNNSEAYWGLGVICHQRGQTPEAIRMLSKGVEIDTANSMLIDDLATLYIHQYKTSQQPADLDQAFTLLDQSLRVDSTNATTFLKLSVAEFQRENYEKAWKHLHHCRELDFQVLDIDYIEELKTKAADPLGFFK
ncbi:MAG: hypothetical protein QM669_08045 [Siphonobacter sp.]